MAPHDAVVRQGALPDEWSLWRGPLACSNRVVPIVANVGLDSTLDSSVLGKAVSIKSGGRIVGMKDWPKALISEADRDEWSKDPDYNFGLKTGYAGEERALLGIDIDFDDPLGMAHEILGTIERVVGCEVPRRGRSNSPKMLVPLWLMRPDEGEWQHRITKKILGVYGNEDPDTGKRKKIWATEILGDGQQFVACGTHTSGVRYEWTWPDGVLAIPMIEAADLDTLITEILELTGAELSSSRGVTITGSRHASDIDDPIVQMLEDKGLVLRTDGSGRVFVDCPWGAEHGTPKDDDSQAAYLPRGVGGMSKPAFKCLHASCEERDLAQYLEKVKLREQGQAALATIALADMPELEPEAPAVPGAPAVQGDPAPLRLGAFRVNRKTGVYDTDFSNVAKAVQDHRLCGYTVVFDEFTQTTLFGVGDGSRGLRPITDEDQMELRSQLTERGIPNGGTFGPISAEAMSEALYMVSKRNRMDSAIQWLDRLPAWDGVPRVQKFFRDYGKAEDCRYHDVVSLYMWIALVERTRRPGFKVDQMIILVGVKGGERKSTFVEALLADPRACKTVALNEDAKDLARKQVGAQILLVEELKGLSTADGEHIKTFVTQRVEEWVPKFKEKTVFYPRRNVIIGATNFTEVLSPKSGERRWLPVVVGSFDIPRVIADRDQLWAEAKILADLEGLPWEEAEALGIERFDQHRVVDTWEDAVGDWWARTLKTAEETGVGLGGFTTGEILVEALNIPLRDHERHVVHLSTVLRRLGFALRPHGKRRVRLWFKEK